ncbi:MAG: Multiple sugar transport system permease protein [Frankiales bacterium]|jgi:multiple sugar transport system permease protein|nr:Multiple sugar transport system permease protein [Frankiales bacterium]
MTTTTDAGSRRIGAPEPSGRKPAKRSTDRAQAERRLGIKLAAPAAILMLAVTAFPILYAIWLSLQRYDLRNPDDKGFVGLSNYLLVLGDGTWWTAVGSTTLITVVSVFLELVIGLAFALVMHRAIFGRRTVRTAILVPYGIITVISAFAFAFAVAPDTGFLPGSVDPLSSTGGSFATIILTEVWKTTPFMSLLLLAGLATVPEELQEAAKVDGATAWQRLWKITLPNMKGAIMVALLFRALDAFRIFDTVYVQTAGALNTQTISGLGYNALVSRVNLGLGSAISILLFLMIIAIAFVFVKLFKTNLGTVKGGD